MTDPVSKSLNAIYGWPDTTGEADYPLIMRVWEACRKPVSDLEPEDIRLLIGQEMCLDYLMPLALDIVEIDPNGETYECDGNLLKMCLMVDATFWHEYPALRPRLEAIAKRIIFDQRDEWEAYHMRDLVQECKNFLNSY